MPVGDLEVGQAARRLSPLRGGLPCGPALLRLRHIWTSSRVRVPHAVGIIDMHPYFPDCRSPARRTAARRFVNRAIHTSLSSA